MINRSHERYKYPRTFHLPFSPGLTRDDKIGDPQTLWGEFVVVTEKRDGENVSLYSDGYIHARSIDSTKNPGFSFLQNWWAKKAHLLPDGYRICGENLYACHSIPYNKLTSYLEIFSIWEGDRCLSWRLTEQWAEKLGVPTVPVIDKLVYNEKDILGFFNKLDFGTVEGIVVRYAGSFRMVEFESKVFKAVRPNHVQTDEHWNRSWTRNHLL